MEVKDKIKELRNSTGMNRREFCDYFGIPYRTVTEWELGNRHMPDYVLRLLEYQIYDAFSLLTNIVSEAKNNIILVDNYVDVGTLNIFAKKHENVVATIYTVKKTRLTDKDIDTFNMQYPKLELRYTGVFHDRFLIVDNKKAYHIGASLKDAGKKCFAISALDDSGIIRDIMQRLEIESEADL